MIGNWPNLLFAALGAKYLAYPAREFRLYRRVFRCHKITYAEN